jgi:hypothetical protein
MRPRKALNEFSRLMNHNLPCPRCNERIERLAAHMDSKGRPICLRKSEFDKQMEAFQREWAQSVAQSPE